MSRTLQEIQMQYDESFLSGRMDLEQSIHAHVESPIEELMVWGLLACDGGTLHEASYTMGATLLPGHQPDKDILSIEPNSAWGHWPRLIYLQPVVRVADEHYRIDIALEHYDKHLPNARVFVAVECDGHDFHERTKEQAERDKKRDRDLQSIGWTIARFTGSEIVRDAYAAAYKVIELSVGILSRRREVEKEIQRAKRGEEP